jgi:hypothetical protein
LEVSVQGSYSSEVKAIEKGTSSGNVAGAISLKPEGALQTNFSYETI